MKWSIFSLSRMAWFTSRMDTLKLKMFFQFYFQVHSTSFGKIEKFLLVLSLFYNFHAKYSSKYYAVLVWKEIFDSKQSQTNRYDYSNRTVWNEVWTVWLHRLRQTNFRTEIHGGRNSDMIASIRIHIHVYVHARRNSWLVCKCVLYEQAIARMQNKSHSEKLFALHNLQNARTHNRNIYVSAFLYPYAQCSY